MNESQDNTLSEKWKKATNAKITVTIKLNTYVVHVKTLSEEKNYEIEKAKVEEAIKIQTNNHTKSEKDALEDLIKKALSIPVIYNECFWSGDCNDVEIVIIGHNPKLPTKEELDELLSLKDKKAKDKNISCINEVYQYWNGVHPDDADNNEIQPIECLIKVSEIFRKYYFTDYVKYHGPASITQKILLLDISPLRGVPYKNKNGKNFINDSFKRIREFYTKWYSKQISKIQPKEIWLVGKEVRDYFEIKNININNGVKLDKKQIKKLSFFSNEYVFPFKAAASLIWYKLKKWEESYDS